MKTTPEGEKRPLILVIDDEPAQLKTIADVLELEELQPFCCRTGKEALEACQQQDVNVAILDLRLPDMNGLELLKQLKQRNPEIKVIIHTGYASLESAMAAINEAAYAYVNKMDNVEELLVQVHRAFHAHLTLYSEKLEQEVQKRTAELFRANQELKKEIAERKLVEIKLQQYQEQLRTLASELSLAEERERRRIAEDLHDHIGQSLTLAKIKLTELRKLASSTNLAQPLTRLHKIIHQTIKDTRSLIFELSPPILYELGFVAAVEWLAEQFYKQHGILVDFEDDQQPKPLADDMAIFLFKAVRELLINVAKHAKAHKTKISLQKINDHLQIFVEDDGIGFNVSEIETNIGQVSGFGLFNIRERLDHQSGNIEIESEPGHGTRVMLDVPLIEPLKGFNP